MSPILSTFGAASSRTYGFSVASGAPSAWVYEYGDYNEKALQEQDQCCLWVNNTYGGVMGLHQDGVSTDTGKSGRPAVAHILNSDGEQQLVRVLKHQNFSTNTLYQVGGCALGDDGRFWAHLQYKHDGGTWGQMPVVVHCDANGDVSWARQVGGSSTQNDKVFNMTLDEANNIAHTVHLSPGFSVGVGLITRWNANGTTPWESAYPYSNNYVTIYNDVMYNSVNGHYYHCGYDTESGTRAIVGRFLSGTSSLTRPSGGVSGYDIRIQESGVTFRFHQLAHDSSGNVFAVGTHYTSPRKTVIVKFNESLSIQAKKIITPSATNNDLEASVHIAVDSDDNVIIAASHDDSNSPDRLGSSSTVNTNQDAIIMSFSNDLSTRNWHSIFGSEQHSFHLGLGYQAATEGRRLMTDDNGSFYLCGAKLHRVSNQNKYRFAIAKLPTDGSLIDSLVDASAVGPTSNQYEWRTATETRTVSDYTPSNTDNPVSINTSMSNYTQDSSINGNFAPFNETATTKTTYNI